MTTIAYKDGVLAADSCETTETESAGTYKNTCLKIFRVGPYAVALQGESSPGMVWLNWFREAHQGVNADGLLSEGARCAVFKRALQTAPAELIDRWMAAEADFTAVVAVTHGGLFEYDAWGTPMEVNARQYAVGSGAKAALCAMVAGAGAVAAIEAACVVDPYTTGPVHSEKV